MPDRLLHERLVDAYAGFRRAEHIARHLRLMAAYDAEQRRYDTLQHYARLCGCPTWHVLTWCEATIPEIERELSQ